VEIVSIPFNDREAQATGLLHVENGPWVGPRKILHFADTVYGNEGTIICDCRESTPRIRFDRTFSPMSGVEETSRVLTMVLRPFLAGQFSSLALDSLRQLYARDYCLECLDPLMESGLDEVEQRVAQQVIQRLGPGRILVAGCGRGRGVLYLRELGADAWGVDLSPDLEEILVPEARPFVREGSVHELPFGGEETFDVLLCLGVLEHLPEHLARQVPGEAARLQIRQLVTMIDHHDFVRPGHLTLRPLTWWAECLASRFSPARAAFPLPAQLPALPWGGPDLKHRLRLWTYDGETRRGGRPRSKAERSPVFSGPGGPSPWDSEEPPGF